MVITGYQKCIASFIRIGFASGTSVLLGRMLLKDKLDWSKWTSSSLSSSVIITTSPPTLRRQGRRGAEDKKWKDDNNTSNSKINKLGALKIMSG